MTSFAATLISPFFSTPAATGSGFGSLLRKGGAFFAKAADGLDLSPSQLRDIGLDRGAC